MVRLVKSLHAIGLDRLFTCPALEAAASARPALPDWYQPGQQHRHHAVGEVHVVYIGDDQHEADENEGELYLHVREARKRFQQFLRTETRSLGSDEPYSAQLMRQQGQHRTVDIDLTDVKNYDGVLGQQLEEKPNTFLPLVSAA